MPTIQGNVACNECSRQDALYRSSVTRDFAFKGQVVQAMIGELLRRHFKWPTQIGDWLGRPSSQHSIQLEHPIEMRIGTAKQWLFAGLVMEDNESWHSGLPVEGNFGLRLPG